MSIARCKVNSCERDIKAKEYCSKHYLRMCRNGTLEVKYTKGLPDYERVMENLIEDGECLVWKRKLHETGYGRTWIGSTQKYVHRYVYEYNYGELPKDIVIDHLCRNKACARLSHLEAVTQSVNVQRGDVVLKSKTRTHCKRGHVVNKNVSYIYKGAMRCRVCIAYNQRKYTIRKKESQ